MESLKEVNSVMSELHSGYGSSLYNALIMIRNTFIKSRSTLNQLVQLGAVKLLVQLLEDHNRHVNKIKATDVMMSILANLCMEEDIREKVVSCEGMSVIARVTLSSEQESIQNRGVRALANLALNVTNCEKIFDLEVPAFVAKRLMETEDVDCRSTYCRALQLFGQTGRDAKRLMEETQAIQALAAQLKLDNRKLALKSLRILSELSALRCCSSFTGQILSANILEELVTLADDDDSSAASYSLSIILRLCEQGIMRPALGSAGVISLLVKLMKSDRSFVNKVYTLNALCLCTKEAVNRIKIQETGGLELFISALNESRTSHFSEGQFSVLYDRIISSLVNFLYNDDCLVKLLELGLVRILIDHLKRSCTFTSLKEDLRKEIDTFAVLLYTNEISHSDRARLLTEDNKIETSGSGSSSKKRDVYLHEDPVSYSFSGFSNAVGSDQNEGEDFETDANNPILEDQINEAHEKVSKEELQTNDKEVDSFATDNNIVTNNDEMEIDNEYENLVTAAQSDDLELPFQQANKSQHTFSINSPTYEIETSWRLEDYTSGVTCKSFSQEQEAHRLIPHHSSYSVNTGMILAPYSPLSAGASYYSPSQSSPSHSGLLSPLQSTIPSSPTSTPYRSSPAWSFSSLENQNSPDRPYSPYSARSFSSLSLAHQNQFSPLTNDFPDSPLVVGEGHLQSPSQNSQASLFSQGSFVPNFEKPIESSDPAEHIDRLLASREASTSGVMFAAVPLSQDTMDAENIYSASEDDSDDACRDVDNELISSPLTCECDENTELHQTLDSCSTKEDTLSTQLLSNERCKSAHNPISQKRILDKANITGNSKRRRLSDNTSTVGETSKAGHHSSGDIIPDVSSSDDEEIINLTPDHIVTNSSTVCILQKDDVHVENTSSSTKIDEMCTKQEIQRPSSVSFHSTLASEKVKWKSLQRTASYPGKRKGQVKTSNFRRHFSAAVSPTSRLGVSPLASTLSVYKYDTMPIISDSPYRSPFPEHAYNSAMSNENLNTDVETDIRSKGQLTNNSSVPEKSCNVSTGEVCAVAHTADKGTNTKIDSTTGTRSDQNISRTRVNKIHRTTEVNILILLARISVKTIPTPLLSETSVISCLLGYIASAPNPIRRSCRILHRLCINPHCFEKLILMQMPAMLVKTLVLEKDGSFPHEIFCTKEDQSDLLPSSQGSEYSGSQTSEFGRKMDFEFGGDAYSRMTSKKNSAVGSIFQNRSNIFGDFGATRDGLSGSDDIYEAGSSRVETRLRIGLGLLHTMGSVAMTKFGDGEIQHLLMRHPTPDKLACMISMLHLRVGWSHITRQQYFTKYSLCEKILPCLFTHEAPLIREAVVAAISLNVHFENPPKLTQKIIKLPICPDVKSETDHNKFVPAFGADSTSELSKKHSDIVMKSKGNLSLGHRQKIDCSLYTTSLCPYQSTSHSHDVHFFIQENNGVSHKLSSHRRTLMEKSEVFAAMFCGSYSESTQSEIPVQEVSRDAFEFIIHYLHGCSSGCPVIDSLSVVGVRDEILAKEVPISSDCAEKQKSDSTAQPSDQVTDIEDNSDFDQSVSNKLNDDTKSLLEGRKNIENSAERKLRTETSAYTSPMLELTLSQDSLDNLTLDDISETRKTLHASRKLNFQNSQVDDDSKDIEANLVNIIELSGVRNEELSETTQKCLDELINKCGNILTLADRFLLRDLVHYLASVLSHVCLCPHTIEDIFHLACFYKLDSLAYDCIRETLMSCLPCSDAAAIYVELAADGYREQVHTALTWLLKYMQSD